MKRRLFNLVTAMSSLTCIATLALMWHSTYQRHYYAFYQTYVNDPVSPHDGVCDVQLGGGQFTAVRRYDDRGWLHADLKPVRGWRHGSVPADGSLNAFRAIPQPQLSFHFDARGWLVALPLWLVAALTAVAPFAWVARTVRARRVRQSGRCTACDYDLRATPQRCPECGTLAAEA